MTTPFLNRHVQIMFEALFKLNPWQTFNFALWCLDPAPAWLIALRGMPQATVHAAINERSTTAAERFVAYCAINAERMINGTEGAIRDASRNAERLLSTLASECRASALSELIRLFKDVEPARFRRPGEQHIAGDGTPPGA